MQDVQSRVVWKGMGALVYWARTPEQRRAATARVIFLVILKRIPSEGISIN
jgi:hypothetical protein